MCMTLNHFTCVSTNSSQITKKKTYSALTGENARNFLSGLFVQVTHTKSYMFLCFFFLVGMAWLDFLSLL